MDKTICSNHLTVPSDDDVPFTSGTDTFATVKKSA